MKKKLLFFIALCIVGISPAWAQQDPQYSMYMFNGLLVNPAYAGSRELVSVTALGRYQWVGIDGSPKTATFSIHGPSRNEKSGFGLNVYNDRLGFTNQTAANAMYAYRLELGPGILSLGLQGGALLHNNRWQDAVTINPDAGAPATSTTAILPMAGTGAYYYGERFYLGAAIPNFIPNKYKNPNSVNGSVASRQKMHLFATAGVVIPLGEDLDLKPSVMMKYTQNAPIEFDFNAAMLFKKVLWVGASYRTGDALVFMSEYVFKNQFRLGYAYDLTLTPLRTYNSGSHEIMLGLDLGWNKSRIKTPRYF
ncbi:MAG: type IX secretion system membrane protein PorP/SprF [Bacteroidetes bacterium]|jgi:type IX secretion system PorP/SprF family membrane protein|nr:type IX secretion system membrane protein PorP/SprF [Bacteroidota bacterium]MBP6639938.1 type IX secretion system membrane protein PorP/SprF [Bacteroidia bacterium]